MATTRPITSAMPGWFKEEYPELFAKVNAAELYVYKTASNTGFISIEDNRTELEAWIDSINGFVGGLNAWKNIDRSEYFRDFIMIVIGYNSFSASKGTEPTLLNNAKFENIIDLAGVGPILKNWKETTLYTSGREYLGGLTGMLDPLVAQPYEEEKIESVKGTMVKTIMSTAVKDMINENQDLLNGLGLSKGTSWV